MLEAITRNLSAAIDMGMKNVAQQRVIRDAVELGIAREIPMGQDVGDRNVINFKVEKVSFTYSSCMSGISSEPLIFKFF